MIKEDMEFMGPVRMKDVEEAQQKIVSVIRKLEDAGEIVISRGGGDDRCLIFINSGLFRRIPQTRASSIPM